MTTPADPAAIDSMKPPLVCSLCEQGNTVRAYGLRTVQFKSIGGAKNSWEKAVPLCKEHRRRFCRTWRYAPTA
ncbi:hypothetical protein LCGC14_2947170 [marine sediment metagenome]|uniref:Uncharacterized protein n=1 Tax=marine sediment metagenome TaxID=412755 RepID=A0A0F8XG37_9ZZZZ